ncbi:aromatase/cyclase [Amycolatopsis sp. cmx-4-83]|uniref:aromatase/cyclase n=1 Tax=Amycolatopsis sp. cmx-4-83 TaxID=2790940 RepID=UPI00397C4C1A
MTSTERTDRHEVEIAAAAEEVFSRLLDVSRWAEMFEPTIHGCELSRDGAIQNIQLWATANGEPKTWVSQRVIDDDARTIHFSQTVPSPPVAAMTGQWTVTPTDRTRCAVELLHTYRADDGTGETLDWISRAVDVNSSIELSALKTACESTADAAGAPFTFSDHVDTDAAPERVFAFLDRGNLWAERLDHVAEVEMRELPGGLQHLRMNTRTSDGDTHLTESFRVSQPPAVLLYKQTTLPRLLTLHIGRWTIRPAGEKWRVTSTHTIAVRPEVIVPLLGPGVTTEQARVVARRNLGTNSLRTLEAAVRWAAANDVTRK